MTRTMRIYYYAVLGAIGGLVGWQISNFLGLSFVRNLYLSDAVVGALIGMSIGLPLGAAEGLIALQPLGALRSGLFGALQGLAAGAIGLPLGELFFNALGAGLLGRAVGWGLFGLLIGLGEGITGGTQLWKGAVGGALGGALGGMLLEVGRRFGADLSSGKALGLLLLGAAIGALIALIVVLLSRAWLEVTSGKMRGTTFILDKFMRAGGPAAVIGSSTLKAEIALPDPDIAPQHALLIGAGTHFSLKDISLKGTFLNGRKVEQARLADGARIQLGNTTLSYHERR